MSDTRPHDHQHRDRFLDRLRARLSYANVMATLGVFLALTGTATAAVVLPRDSVGAEQIQTDAVRSPEIQADAVRGSKILDESVVLADLSPGARSSLDAPRVRVDDGGPFFESLSTCFDLLDCSNLLAVHLPAGRWLVQATITILANFPDGGTNCGLVQSDTTIIREAEHVGAGFSYLDDDLPVPVQASEQVALSAVVTNAPGVDSTTVALRCEEHDQEDKSYDHGYWEGGQLTAIEVKDAASED
jgi:hypothetical protein